MVKPRIFFAAGPGNVIEAHRRWRSGEDDPSQMSITFSSELEEFCSTRGYSTYVVASRSPPAKIEDGGFIVEHRPKAAGSGIRYHLIEIRYGLSLLATALSFRADYAVVQSGTTHYFVLALFRLCSIRVIPVLHNTLWPRGRRYKSRVRGLIGRLDGIFFRKFATATICVSPECKRQVVEITSGQHGPIREMAPQFNPELYVVSPPPSSEGSFRLIFCGRITRDKGVFDLLEIMKRVDMHLPSQVKLQICGIGPDLERLQFRCKELELGGIVEILGRVEPTRLRELITSSHAAIVPTRSEFPEGLAMSAIEPVLLGRPVITNPVVPAVEVLRDACLVANTDDVLSYVDTVISLVRSPELYRQLASACLRLREAFFDGSKSFGAALEEIIP